MTISRRGSTSDLAKLLGITVNGVQKLAQKKVVRPEQHGIFDLPDSVQAYLAYREGLIAAQQGKGGYSKARTAWTQERAKKARLEREEMEGALLRREKIVATWTTLLAGLKMRMLAIPNKVAARLVGLTSAAEIARIIMGEVRDSLEECASSDGLPRDVQRKAKPNEQDAA